MIELLRALLKFCKILLTNEIVCCLILKHCEYYIRGEFSLNLKYQSIFISLIWNHIRRSENFANNLNFLEFHGINAIQKK